MARKLRIAASAFFAVVTLSLIVLWVRTQSAWDKVTINFSDARGVTISSISGTLSLEIGKPFFGVDVWKWQSGRAVGSWTGTSRLGYSTAGVYVVLPYWLLVAWTAIFAGLPWLRTKSRPSFSMRAMFIAMTLSAIALALGVWLAS